MEAGGAGRSWNPCRDATSETVEREVLAAPRIPCPGRIRATSPAVIRAGTAARETTRRGAPAR